MDKPLAIGASSTKRLLIAKTLTTCLLFLTSCSQTTLLPPEPITVATLSFHNKIALTLDSALESEAVGRQYAAFILPLGEVLVREPLAFLVRSLKEEAALQEIALVATSSKIAPRSKVILKTLIVNAYDYIFVRHLVAEIEVEVHTRSGEVYTLQNQADSWEQYGFAPELSDVTYHAFCALARDVLLSIPKP